MNKKVYRITSLLMALALTLGTFFSVQASPQYTGFYKRLALGDSANWTFEKSGTLETITATSDGWVCQVGGYEAGTHYARMKYKLPEFTGQVLTTFYMKAVLVLPADFYTQQQAGLRLLNTSNTSTTLNGVQVGASDSNELRTAVYINSDHSLRIIADHQNVAKKEFYRSAAPLAVGEHTFELYGSLSEAAPWYFKVDGVVLASGVERLSPDSVPVNERIATRLIVGIDGAADQDQNLLQVSVKSFEIADYDLSGSYPNPPTPTATAMAPTATPIQPTPTPLQPTPTMAPTATPVQPTATSVIQPSATPTQVLLVPTNTSVPPTPTVSSTPIPPGGGSETVYNDSNPIFLYSIGWWKVSESEAYGGSYKKTNRNGATVTFPFTGQSFSILYKGGNNSGKFDVLVDGVSVGTLNQKLSVISYQQRWDYPGQLPAGKHTLKLVFQSSKPASNGSLDAVIVR